jgi:amino acid adenylation domain-containing protein
MKKTGIQDRLQESFQAFSRSIAIRRGTQTLTYEELDRKSNCVAHWLLYKKMNRHTLIGILMNDRIRFIYTMIGILKAGCIFVSLDPAYPDSRLERMINFIGTQLVLTDEVNRNRGRQREFTCIDDFLPAGGPGDGTRPPKLTYSGEDPVYIYFTSGTTGTPKGILGKNKSLRQFIQWEVKTFNVDETYRISQLTTPGFDAVLRDIFVPLFAGGCICIPEDPEILANSERLIRWIDSSDLRLLHCVPSLFRVLNVGAPGLSPNHFKELKYVLLSGERIPPRELVRWYEIFDERIQLVNFWGPTETTMIKTFHFIRRADIDKERIPIGKPMKGARVIIMDEAMKVCKERMTGRLYIRTPYRSFGYCNDPDSTHEKFINNPFNNDPADLLYDTGDLGRLLPDGSIEFLGREDRQVKIMGIRVELEGIENALLKYPSVDEAVVIKGEAVSSSTPGEELLIAYITAKENEAAAETLEEDIRTFLSGELPVYMVPPIIMAIEEIPRKPNGKIDHESLPAPFTTREKDYVPPANHLQAKLANLWSETLNIDKISIDSHFFRLGGNSLNLMALVTKIHKEFDIRVPLEKMLNNPTIEMLAAVINELKKEQYSSIEPMEKKEYDALSPAQERLFFLYRVDKNSVVYNMPRIMPVEGELDREKLKEIFRKIIRRHDSFRTTFEMVRGKPVQRVHEHENPGVEISYLQCSEAETENITGEFFRPFDLNKAPLLRVSLLTVESGRQILLIDMHHIITDEASQILLEKEFKGLYAGEELPRMRLQYKDYAGWQNSGEQKSLIKEQERYWLEVFAGEVPVLNIPTDYSRPMIQSFEGNTVGFVLTVKESRILTGLAKETDTTLYMCILSIFTILLSRLSGQEDIVVGTPAAGRRHADLEKIIGMFVNTLPMRNKPRGKKRYAEFLKELEKNTLKAYENQDYPFEELVENVSVRRDLSRNPVFDVIVNFVNIDKYTYNIPGIEQAERNQYRHVKGSSKVDLTLTALEVGQRLLFTIEYCTRLFKPETINRFISYFKRLLSSLSGNLDVRLSEMELIPGKEKRRILFEFNDTAPGYPGDKTLHELFDEQAAGAGDKIALDGRRQEAGEEEHFAALTYRELNDRANRLACLLKERGVFPDTIVGIVMERSVEMVVGLLGILKAGGAYLPIDPDYPKDRIDFMLKDSSAGVLVITPGLTEKFEESITGNCQFSIVNCQWSMNEAASPSTLTSTRRVSPANLAYIIYTSGSTGRPKGVMIEHWNVVRLLFADGFQFDFSQQDVWTMFHSYCFDFSVWEMYGALLFGAKLIVIPKMAARDTRQYLQVLKKHGVTVLNQTPSAFYHLADNELACPDRTLHLRYVIFGGEALNPGKLNAWKLKYPDTKLVNMLGITETTVHVTYKEITEGEIEKGTSNIGTPIPTLATYVLDRHQKPLPLGAAGELCVSGAGVGRGYLNRPGLTGERFSPDPFRNGERLYKSGDLVRLLENGEMEYQGRIDHQVKIRGFRVELGEIENQLMKHEKIKEAVVLLEKEHLYAYIVTGGEFNAAQLREFLSRQLPDHMVPSYFRQVKNIPLTSNGKVDGKALALLGKQVDPGTAYVAPRYDIEKKIAGVWQEVLNLEKVGIHDNYFELGGTSFDILKINEKLKERLHKDIPVVAMFTYPTVHSFAGYLNRTHGDKEVEIRDRAAVYDKSKKDRKEQLRRRKGHGN